MKKIFALLFVFVASFGLLTACNEKTPTVEPTEPTVVEISQDLKNAKNYIKNIYQGSEGNVTANMERAAKLPVGGKEFTITWALEVTSGDATAVSVAKSEDNTKWIVNVKYDNTITAEVKFVLTATITAADGESTTQSFNYTIPAFEANTIAQMIEEADKEKIYFLEGVITAVNKTEGKTAFIITDATGSIFCYDGLEVQLGQKVQITGNYSAYNDAFHQLASPVLVKVLAENQDLAAACGTPLVTTATEINNAAKAEGATAVSLTEAYGGKYLEVTGYVVASGSYANLAVAADAASCCNLYANDSLNLKSFIGAKVVIKGYARGVSVGNGITIQIQSVALAEGESMPTPPATEYEEPAVTNKTLAEIIAMDDANNGKAAYKVTATVSKLGQKDTDTAAGKYGNLWVGEGEEKILVYGATATKTALVWDKTTGAYAYTNAKDFDSNTATKDIKVGDSLELLVIRGAYNGTPQLSAIVLSVNGTAVDTPVEDTPTEEPVEPTVPTVDGTETVLTVEAALAASAGTIVTVKGEVVSVKTSTSNSSFVLTDGTNEITVYGLFKNSVEYASWTEGKDIAAGDTLTVKGTRGSYTGAWDGAPTVQQVQECAFVAIQKVEKPVVTAPVGTLAATMDFKDLTNRTVSSNTQQVWVKNGITLTNDKASSTSNVNTANDPIRLYQGSTVTIEFAEAITSIVIKTGDSKNFAATFSLPDAGVLVDGNTCTIVLIEPATSFTFSLSAQVRALEVNVYTAASAE